MDAFIVVSKVNIKNGVSATFRDSPTVRLLIAEPLKTEFEPKALDLKDDFSALHTVLLSFENVHLLIGLNLVNASRQFSKNNH